ncbi:hypothetical protein [Streptomyces sp. ISL-100]|uniref:hypothetical protein n=1 Tax=Streptomyces sp. ISL-100 TaxID=2819173 RepID=UPI001BE806F7|nr:hypothetical protein [Streptomyces sp. ISL-100]MBT2398191.1 hypothetical protein [Streptomyces sp. ISL-100]
MRTRIEPGTSRVDRRLPRCEYLVRTLRRSRILSELAPMECGIGWPVPIAVIQDGEPRVFARLPLFVLRPDPAGGADLFPPIATATVGWSTGRLVEYTDLRFKEPHRSRQEWAHPIGRFPHPAVEGLSNAGYRALRTRLFSLYDELFAAFSLGRQPDAAVTAEFRELLGRLLEPCLVPSYRRLAPKFLRQYLPGDHLPDEG